MSFRWRMVMVAVLGLICGPGPINIFAFGEFLKPVSEDLGVSRELLTLALVLTTALGAVINFLIGWSIDRFGTRPTLLSIIPIFAAGIFSYSLMTSNPATIFAAFGFVGLTATVTGPTGYAALSRAGSTANAAWRSASPWPGWDWARRSSRRSALFSSAISAGASPIAASRSWCWCSPGCRPGSSAIRRRPISRASPIRGPTARWRAAALVAALKSWRFWALTAAFFLSVVGINGTVAHTVPMLTDRGMSLALAPPSSR